MSSRHRLLPLLGVLGALLLVGLWRGRFGNALPRKKNGPTHHESPAALPEYLALEAREKASEESVWGPELQAERQEDELVRLWDALNAAPDPWRTLIQFAPDTIALPEFTTVETLDHGIRRWRGGPTPAAELEVAAWRARLELWQAAGWSLGRTSWQLLRWRPAAGGSAAESEVRVTAQLIQGEAQQRALLRADLALRWAADTNGPEPHLLRVGVRGVEFLRRDGPPPFTPWLDEVLPAGTPDFPDPLIATDLDGDGLSELLLVGADRVWRNRPGPGPGQRQFVPQSLGLHPDERIVAAALGEVAGPGPADLLLAGRHGLKWHRRTADGFDPHAETGWISPEPLRHPQVLALGDVDGDGDLDVWLAQYKLPYQGGQFPTPYYDAQDGFAAHLLLNDGHGHFTDATEASGLAPKRHRRTYSASFIDLDGDGDLDLVTVSDFAGLDVYLNDGHGKFTDVTQRLGDTRHGFGMAHVFGDFNGDGRPDLLMLGMDSVVAGRLDALGLGRPEWPDHTAKRAAMAFGNRLFQGAEGGFRPAPVGLAQALAHTGWTWGAAWADFDNDRELDLATASGHETRPSTRDYERQFWLHDIYTGASTNQPAAELYYRAAAGRRQAEGASYGGWQNNAFRLNCGGGDFPEVAWLLGLAVPADCHNLLADDLDGDGRLDLVVTTYEQWPVKRQRLLIFHNELPLTNQWIGFRLEGDGRVPVGARVELEDPAGRQTRWLVAGDSYRSQSAAAAHFGLGTNLPLRALIRWPDGRQTVLSRPAVNRWHRLAPPR